MRKLRYPPLQSGYTYHICNQGNNRENIFKEPRNYPYFLKKYLETIHPIVHTFAFCFLPNHFHILVQFKTYQELHNAFPEKFPTPSLKATCAEEITSIEESEYDELISELLSKHFAGWFSGYSRAINKSQNRKGKLFMQRFERILVSNESYFTYLVAYIHRNPIHHHFCTNFETWLYSSYVYILYYLKHHKIKQEATDSYVYQVAGIQPSNDAYFEQFHLLSNQIIDFPFLLDWFGNSNDYLKVHQDALGFLDDQWLLE